MFHVKKYFRQYHQVNPEQMGQVQLQVHVYTRYSECDNLVLKGLKQGKT